MAGREIITHFKVKMPIAGSVFPKAEGSDTVCGGVKKEEKVKIEPGAERKPDVKSERRVKSETDD